MLALLLLWLRDGLSHGCIVSVGPEMSSNSYARNSQALGVSAIETLVAIGDVEKQETEAIAPIASRMEGSNLGRLISATIKAV